MRSQGAQSHVSSCAISHTDLASHSCSLRVTGVPDRPEGVLGKYIDIPAPNRL